MNLSPRLARQPDAPGVNLAILPAASADENREDTALAGRRRLESNGPITAAVDNAAWDG
jgi:hypothetical protein